MTERFRFELGTGLRDQPAEIPPDSDDVRILVLGDFSGRHVTGGASPQDIDHRASGVRILAAPQRPEMADKISTDQFAKVVQYLQRMYAYVVIDTSHILSDIVLSMFDISDAIVLLTTQEIPAIKNARLFLDLLQTMGIGKDRVVFAMNRYDKRIGITPERVSENLKHEISVAIPLDEKVVITAVNRGVPFMLDNKAQPVGRGIFSLAEAVRARLTALETEDEASVKR